jgi:hypothetical protein
LGQCFLDCLFLIAQARSGRPVKTLSVTAASVNDNRV